MMTETDLVIKGNQLIEAQGKLSLLEQKVVLTVISQIEDDDEDFKPYVFQINEFATITGSSYTSIYSDIHRIAKNIMKKTITIKNGKKAMTTAFFSSVETNEGSGKIEFSFDPKLKPYLLQLKRNFTSYQLQNILQLRSGHSIRLYELLKQYEKIGKREVSIDELKAMVGLNQGQYKKISDFERYVLKPAQEELESYTDLSFEYEKIRKGRKIERIKFNIKSKGKQQTFEEYEFYSRESRKIITAVGLEKENFSYNQIFELIEIASKKTDAYLNLSAIEYMRVNYNTVKDKKPDNRYAYYKTALEKDFANIISRELEKEVDPK